MKKKTEEIVVEQLHRDEAIKVVNELLLKCGIDRQVKALKDCSPSCFVLLLEHMIQKRLREIVRKPETIIQHRYNIECVLTYLHSLGIQTKINPELLYPEKDETSLIILITIFEKIAKYIFSPHNSLNISNLSSLTETGNPDDITERLKQEVNFAAKNQSSATTLSTTSSTGQSAATTMDPTQTQAPNKIGKEDLNQSKHVKFRLEDVHVLDTQQETESNQSDFSTRSDQFIQTHLKNDSSNKNEMIPYMTDEAIITDGDETDSIPSTMDVQMTNGDMVDVAHIYDKILHDPSFSLTHFLANQEKDTSVIPKASTISNLSINSSSITELDSDENSNLSILSQEDEEEEYNQTIKCTNQQQETIQESNNNQQPSDQHSETSSIDMFVKQPMKAALEKMDIYDHILDLVESDDEEIEDDICNSQHDINVDSNLHSASSSTTSSSVPSTKLSSTNSKEKVLIEENNVSDIDTKSMAETEHSLHPVTQHGEDSKKKKGSKKKKRKKTLNKRSKSRSKSRSKLKRRGRKRRKSTKMSNKILNSMSKQQLETVYEQLKSSVPPMLLNEFRNNSKKNEIMDIHHVLRPCQPGALDNYMGLYKRYLYDYIHHAIAEEFKELDAMYNVRDSKNLKRDAKIARIAQKRWRDKMKRDTKATKAARRSHEEGLMRDLYKRMIRAERERIVLAKGRASEEQARLKAQLKNKLESLNNYYNSQIQALREDLHHQQKDRHLASKAQRTAVSKLAREARQRYWGKLDQKRQRWLSEEEAKYHRRFSSMKMQKEVERHLKKTLSQPTPFL